MSQLRLLFDAMDADGLLAFYVTAATCFTVIVLVQLAQLAWHYLEPHVFLLINFRKESEREVSREMLPASSRMAATALRTQVRRDVSSRFASRVAERDRQASAAWPAPRQTYRSGGDAA